MGVILRKQYSRHKGQYQAVIFKKVIIIIPCKVIYWVLKVKSISLLKCNSSLALNKLSFSLAFLHSVLFCFVFKCTQAQVIDKLIRTSYTECGKETSPGFYNPSTSAGTLYNATYRVQLLNLS